MKSTAILLALLSLFVSIHLASCSSSSATAGDADGDTAIDGSLPDASADLLDAALDTLKDAVPEIDVPPNEPDLEVLPDPGAEPVEGVEVTEVEAEAGCTSNATCDGQVCVDGACVACTSGDGCDAPLGCDAETGLCGPCTSASQCPAAQACRNPGDGGECGSCRVADECRAGEACLEGSACGACGGEGAWDCSGQLCDENGSCTACDVGADACADAYGEGFFCNESGRCTTSCTDVFDCLVVGRVCDTGSATCVACDGADACEEGGYALGTPCVEGVCVEASCSVDAPTSCVDKGLSDRPVCAADGTCQPCTKEGQVDDACAAALEVASAVCRPGGACVAGNCYPDGAACGVGGEQICRLEDGETWCGACQGDAECVGAFDGLAYMICEVDACVAGCESKSDCGAGEVCLTHRCTGCTANADCAGVYGDWLCVEGLCQDVACNAEAPCPDGKLCQSHACVSCSTFANPDSACQAALGTGTLCDLGQCVTGECHTNTYNGLGQVCGGDHLWSDCASDAQCQQAYVDLNKICDPLIVGDQTALRCQAGKTPGTACSASGKKVVGADHRCGDCDTDADCENSWGLQYVCDPAEATPDATDEGRVCLAGCTPGQRCSDGKLCRDDKRCTACTDVAEDSLCGFGYLCYEGACVPGVCRADAQCNDNKVCDLSTHLCVGCSDDTPCASGKVCVSGQCLDGNCCVDANCAPQITCGNGQTCTNHRCEGCVVGADCYTQHPCLDRSDACDPDHTCKAVTDLDVLPGFCFIQGTCKEIGKPEKDGGCRVCYWDDDPVTHDVLNGSKIDWTPGSWDTSGAGEWKRTHCYIDKRCVVKGRVEEDEVGYGAVQSANCMQCDPRVHDAASLVTWSPRTDPTASPYEDWTGRIACDDPLYVVPDPANPGATKNARKPAYSGSPTNQGYCWSGTCWGMAWTPWLPLGMAGAGVVAPDAVTLGATTYSFVGSFGGGFGAGLPNTNPGCKEIADCGPCNPFGVACQ